MTASWRRCNLHSCCKAHIWMFSCIKKKRLLSFDLWGRHGLHLFHWNLSSAWTDSHSTRKDSKRDCFQGKDNNVWQDKKNKKQCRDTVGATSSPWSRFGAWPPVESVEHDPHSSLWRMGTVNPPPPLETMNKQMPASLPCQTTEVRLPNGTSHNEWPPSE